METGAGVSAGRMPRLASPQVTSVLQRQRGVCESAPGRWRATEVPRSMAAPARPVLPGSSPRGEPGRVHWVQLPLPGF